MIILGSTGMLGSMMARVMPEALTPRVEARSPILLKDFKDMGVINCIGLIKPRITSPEDAIRVNALFPYHLPENTLQIATDCVYSGSKGNYVESDLHDATDVYGKTKSLGEAPHIKNLRCSIIGPEIKNHISLLDWFLSQKEANGFTNHLWNGVTTYHFAKIAQGVVREGIELPQLQHIVPANKVTKAELLRIIAKAYGKEIPVTDTEAPETVDRTLSTSNPDLNKKLWKAAGYDNPPTIEQMVEEMSSLR